MLGIPLKALQIKTKNIQKKSKDTHRNTRYEKANNFGLVFTIGSKEKHESIKRFIKQLEKDGKKVNCLAYLPKGVENHEFLFSFFSIKDLGFWGNLESESITEFLATKYDYSLFLDTDLHPLVENILSRKKSNFRVGPYIQGKENLFDLMIHIESKNNTEQHMEQVLHYIKLLNNDEA